MARRARPPAGKARSALRPWQAWTGALAAVFALAAVWLVQRPATFSTAAAQRQVVMLEDGTRAELNARTSLRVRMRGAERWVRLEEGEVFLTVTKDPARPFVVETAAGGVRVTGTVFNVRHLAADSLTVVLLEGSVEATSAADDKTRPLVPGDELVVAAGRSQVRRLSPVELAEAVAWREGRIVFHDTPLAQVLERFARHHARAITLAPAAQDLTLGGRFGLDDFDGFLRDLALALPVAVRREPDGSIRVERIQPEGK